MDAAYFWVQDQRSEQRKTGVKFRMGTLDKGLPISGNLVSFWWQAVAPALISGWTSRRFQIDLAMGNDNTNDNNNDSNYSLWALATGDTFFLSFAEAESLGYWGTRPRDRLVRLTTEAVVP